ncbi:glycosyltransferase family 2 protein [Desulfoferrobacter suflitae]|uniref:glycosyltransferase family 2 protein n=1 Tax=Desulfoferrobacter suflitae TaxID=2865782 RepID=UPI002164A9F5|nr:glycosyltransferase family 2 protein [Desulfoferrobacter suflitae]MCK8603855.1 glycosyltransferase family 2 protein [Desulfoferrobacter suflitae]
MIDVSIVIVNWNTRELLKQCLDSVCENITRVSYEIYVVDNASTDGSEAMVAREFPRVKLIRNSANLGFARANNIAMRAAGGRFLLLLNSDTVISKGAIAGLMKTMEADPSIGIAGLQLLNGDGSLQNSICNFPSLLTELTNKSLLRILLPSRYPGKEHRIRHPVQVDAIIGSCMMVRREAVEQVGLLDEDFFFFFEETDWCLRMRRAGWKVVFDPRYAIFHLQGKSAAQVNVRARIEYWRSRYTYFAKHHSTVSQYALRTGLLIRLLISMAGGAACLAMLFKGSARCDKLSLNAAIFYWHLKGCPADGGLAAQQPLVETDNA